MKKILVALGVIVLIVAGCSSEGETSKSSENEDDTWAIYWYLCGSDLESNDGAATEDIQEMLDVTLPENVKVIIETGGANEWQNDTMDADYIERYVYEGNELTLIEQQPLENMGETKTLEDFLIFCADGYSADHEVFLFWNHGGGSVTGAAFDEQYDFDSLTLDEMQEAFEGVYELSKEDPPFEMVGFDACLMATIDTANTFSSISKYLVASEELEPGNGWYYTDGWKLWLRIQEWMEQH